MILTKVPTHCVFCTAPLVEKERDSSYMYRLECPNYQLGEEPSVDNDLHNVWAYIGHNSLDEINHVNMKYKQYQLHYRFHSRQLELFVFKDESQSSIKIPYFVPKSKEDFLKRIHTILVFS